MARASLVARVAGARPASRSNVHVAAARPARAGVGVGPGRPAGSGGPGVGPGHPATRPQKPPANPQTGGAAAPAPPAAAPSGQPWDAAAENEFGAGATKYNDRMAELAADWGVREDWYGLGASKNPYSQAALLERRHEIDRRGNMNTAGLSIYSGSLVNAQAGADRNYSVDLESLRAAFAADQADNQRRKEQALHEWEAEQAQINQEAIERAEEVEPAPAPGPEGGGGGGGGGKKGGGKKGKGGGFAKGETISPSKGKGKGK